LKRLRYLEIEDPIPPGLSVGTDYACARVNAVLLGEMTFLFIIRPPWSIGDRAVQSLLKTLDADIHRFVETADIVEQVVGYILRDKYRKSRGTSYPYGKPGWHKKEINVWFFHKNFEIAVSMDIGVFIIPKSIHYECAIRIGASTHASRVSMDDVSRGLYRKIREELAEIFEKPELTRDDESDIRAKSATIYSNKMVFRRGFVSLEEFAE
jgi:hypothetical protein